jgi:hypothetical protein
MALGLYNVSNPLDKAATVQHGVGQTMAAMSKGGSSTTNTQTKSSGSGIMGIIGAGLAVGSALISGGSTLGLVLGTAGKAIGSAIGGNKDESIAASGGGGMVDESTGWFGLSKLKNQRPGDMR